MNKRGIQQSSYGDPSRKGEFNPHFHEEEEDEVDSFDKYKNSSKKANDLMGFEDREEDLGFSNSRNKKMNEGKPTKPMQEMSIKTSKNLFESSVKTGGLESSAFNMGLVGGMDVFANKYRDNIRKIFDECSEKGEIEIPKLKGLLAEADVHKAFSILTKKLNNLEKHRKGYGPKMREDILKFDDFEKLFEFDLKKEDDFDILFETIDELGNNSNSIGLAELDQANKHYDLGLSSEDMEIMLKYVGKDPNVVTKEELKKAMGVIN